MTPRPGVSALDTLRALSAELGLLAAADEKQAERLEALLELQESEFRRLLRLAKGAAARSRELEERLDRAVRRIEAERRGQEEIPSGRGRKKTVVREEIRRDVRRLLRANPKVGWPAIRDSTGLSESIARRVLREERARLREEIDEVAGGKSSVRRGAR